MGINGLLPQLKSITTKVHVESYKGLSVGIDAHCWLHRGGYCCSKELAEGIETTKYIDFSLSMLRMLARNGVKDIIVVLDGAALPIKGSRNSLRRESRTLNKELAREASDKGHTEVALKHYQRSVSISSEMVQCLIAALKKEGVRFLVSPYEADAQLTHLSKTGAVDVVISEDSDLLVYGCKRILYKLNNEGFGEEIIRKNLGSNQDLSFLNWSDAQFKMFCCLAGCDYNEKIKNFGIKKSHKMVSKNSSFSSLSKALRATWSSSSVLGSDVEVEVCEFLEGLSKSMMTFKHQTVFDPASKKLQHLSPLPTAVSLVPGTANREDVDLDFLGPFFADDVVWGVVTGQLDPHTHLPYASISIQTTGRSRGNHSAEGTESAVIGRGRGSGELDAWRNTGGLSSAPVSSDHFDFDDDQYYINDINSAIYRQLDDYREEEGRGCVPPVTDEVDCKHSTAAQRMAVERGVNNRGARNRQHVGGSGSVQTVTTKAQAQKGQAKGGRVVWVEEGDRQGDQQIDRLGEEGGVKGGTSDNFSSSSSSSSSSPFGRNKMGVKTSKTAAGECGSEEDESKDMWAFECAEHQSDFTHNKKKNKERAASTLHSSSSSSSSSGAKLSDAVKSMRTTRPSERHEQAAIYTAKERDEDEDGERPPSYSSKLLQKIAEFYSKSDSTGQQFKSPFVGRHIETLQRRKKRKLQQSGLLTSSVRGTLTRGTSDRDQEGADAHDGIPERPDLGQCTSDGFYGNEDEDGDGEHGRDAHHGSTHRSLLSREVQETRSGGAVGSNCLRATIPRGRSAISDQDRRVVNPSGYFSGNVDDGNYREEGSEGEIRTGGIFPSPSTSKYDDTYADRHLNYDNEKSFDCPDDEKGFPSNSLDTVARLAEHPLMSRPSFFDDQGMRLISSLCRHPFDSNSSKGIELRDNLHGIELYGAPQTYCPIPLNALQGRFQDNDDILPWREEEGERDIGEVLIAAERKGEAGRKGETFAHRPKSADSEWTWDEFVAPVGRGLKAVGGSASSRSSRGRDTHLSILPDNIHTDINTHPSHMHEIDIGSDLGPGRDRRDAEAATEKEKERTRKGFMMLSMRPAFSLVPKTSSAQRLYPRSTQGIMPFR